jgi:hypothetical protein
MKTGRGNRSPRKKPAPEQLRPPQIPHGPTWDRTLVIVVGILSSGMYSTNRHRKPQYNNQQVHISSGNLNRTLQHGWRMCECDGNPRLSLEHGEYLGSGLTPRNESITLAGHDLLARTMAPLVPTPTQDVNSQAAVLLQSAVNPTPSSSRRLFTPCLNPVHIQPISLNTTTI